MVSKGTSTYEDREASAYEAVGRIVCDIVHAFLASLEFATTKDALVKSGSVEEILNKFLASTDTFAESFCISLARAVRQNALVQETRATPTSTLGSEIRAEAFEALDALVARHSNRTSEVIGQMRQVLGELQDTNVLDAAIDGAAAGWGSRARPWA